MTADISTRIRLIRKSIKIIRIKHKNENSPDSVNRLKKGDLIN